MARRKKRAVACPTPQGAAVHFPGTGAGPRVVTAVHSTDAAPCDRPLLARASDSCRSPRACTCGAQRRTGGLVLAAQKRQAERPAADVQSATGALSGSAVLAWAGPLLRVRATRVPLRMACRSVARGRERECRMAQRLRDRLATLDRAERLHSTPQTPTRQVLRRHRRAALEDGRSRPPHTAVPRLARHA